MHVRLNVRRLAPSLVLTTALVLASSALAHQTEAVGVDGGERYLVIVGMVREPVFTDERNGLDLIVRTPDGDDVTGLETSLTVTLVAPAGQERTLALRPQYGRPGAYTDDVVLSDPGVYRIVVRGFIGAVEVDLTFETHEVRPLADLAFP